MSAPFVRSAMVNALSKSGSAPVSPTDHSASAQLQRVCASSPDGTPSVGHSATSRAVSNTWTVSREDWSGLIAAEAACQRASFDPACSAVSCARARMLRGIPVSSLR